MTPGSHALLHGAALIDLTARGRIRITGEDRARLLHAMTTNHVQQLKPGEGLYAFFLNAQGKILADAYILCFEDHLLVDTEPASRAVLYEHLDRYIIADDVTLEDITEQTFCLGVEGPAAFGLLDGAGLPAARQHYSRVTWGVFDIASVSFTGSPGVRVYGPSDRRDELIQLLEGAGALAASDEDAEIARLRNFKPRFGVDFTEMTLPQETQQVHAMHFQKGCYLGQEIVERIRSRGHVNKTLMGFRTGSPDEVVPKASVLLFEGKEGGEVTSSALTSEGEVSGLAMVRVPHNKSGSEAVIAGRPAVLFAPYSPGLF